MMSRKKSRGVLCFRGGQDEGDVRRLDSVDGEKERKETELFKLMMEDFEKKLGRLMMSSERERQLMDLVKDNSADLQRENMVLKEENKRLDTLNRKAENQLIMAEGNYKNLSVQYNTSKEILRAVNDRLTDMKMVIEKQKEEKADLQSELKTQKDKINNLKSQLMAMDDGKTKCEKQQEELTKEKQQLQLLLIKRDELNQNRLRMAWLRFHEIKEERDSLLASVSKKSLPSRTPQIMAAPPEINEGYPTTDTLPEHLIFETRIMKLEMTLFRRNKLIEILTDRLRALSPDFSLTSDPEVAAYVDDDLEREIGLQLSDVVSQESSEAQLTSNSFFSI